jgi:hypothetical protein
MITQTMSRPVYNELDELLKIFLVEANAKYPISKASAVVVATEELEVHYMLEDKIYEIESIKFIGYADVSYVESKILFLNDGEYINQNLNN